VIPGEAVVDNQPTPRLFRLLFIVATAILLASLAISSSHVYRTVAAPLQAFFTPSTLGFEGWLSNASGQPISGQHQLKFRLYDQESGANPALWTETYSNYIVTNGFYSVQLGSITPLPATAFDGDRWIGITVDSDPEMTPRIAIGSVPFARNAKQTTGLLGYPVSTATPQNGQALTFTSNNQWEPRSIHSGVRVTSTTAQTLFSGSTWQAIQFNTVRWDTEGYFQIPSGQTSGTHLTARRPGKYLIFGNVQFTRENNASYGVRDIAIALNYVSGSPTFIAMNRIEAVQGANDTALSLSTVYELATGQTVDLMILQNSTVSLSTVVVANYSPEFGMVWLGP
jgi:hypothetical protein